MITRLSLFLAFSFISLLIKANQPTVDDTKNYIITYAPRDSVEDISAITQPEKLGATVQYFDGLGRPIQTTAWKQAPDMGDIVSFHQYDALGREPKTYLPFHQTSGTEVSLMDNTNQIAAQQTSYNSIHSSDKSNAFTFTDYENSPLNRVNSVMGPGKNWHDNDKKVIYTYEANQADEVPLFDVESNGEANKNGSYQAGTLYKTTTTDEDGKSTIEWKDLQGRVVQTKAGGGDLWATTIYVYDDFGLLRWVIPPAAASETSFTPEVDHAKTLCYYYKYDERKRLIEKHIPGAEPVYYVYDNRDRLAMSQDGNQRAHNPKKWTIHKYDDLNRLLYSAQITHHFNHILLRNYFKINQENAIYSVATDSNKFLINYYDTYPSKSSSVVWDYQDFSSLDQITDWDEFPASATSNTLGLLTFSLEKELTVSGLGAWLPAIYFYDEKGRMIQSRQYTGNGSAYNLSSWLYNWAGEVLIDRVTYYTSFGASTSQTSTLQTAYSYDHAGRLIKDTRTFTPRTGAASTLVTDLTYDKLGRARYEKFSEAGSIVHLNTTRSYNIRSWAKSILHKRNSSNLMALILSYEDNGSVNRLYSGNIAAFSWINYSASGSSATNQYNFTYDQLNRLKQALHNPNMTNSDRYSCWYGYDLNGNITQLKRKGKIIQPGRDGSLDRYTYGIIDDLRYSYETSDSWESNQLQYVNNVAIFARGDVAPDRYHDYGSIGNTQEFNYDSNGNMISDANKSLDTDYNFLNLPVSNTFFMSTVENQIQYRYTSSGRKTREENLVDGTITLTRLYAGPFTFLSTTSSDPSYVSTPYGRFVQKTPSDRVPCPRCPPVKPSPVWRHETHLRDHLGNTRLAYIHEGTTINKVQETHYYPFGMRISTLSNQPVNLGTERNNAYLYNGKEFNDDFGLNWYDYGARFYDPQIGRWHSVDPHAENYLPISPYAYVANNPIIFIDPDGRDLWHINERGEIVHHDPEYTDADKFVIVSYDSDGNVVEGQSIEFDYETVTAVRRPTVNIERSGEIESNTMTLFEISGDENATQLFEFFADPTNTGVEWTDAKIGYEDSGRNVVGTSHSEEFTAVGGYLRDTNYTLRSVSHNHPGGTGPSGRPGGLAGDIPNAALYHQRNPNTVLSVYIHPNNYIYYNQFGVIRQLPPVQITP